MSYEKGLFVFVTLVMVSGCTRSLTHPAYDPLVGQSVQLNQETQLWRQSGTLIHWKPPAFTLANRGATTDRDDYITEVAAETELKVEWFERRTRLIGISTDYAVVEISLPGFERPLQADIVVSRPSVTEGVPPQFPWTVSNEVDD